MESGKVKVERSEVKGFRANVLTGCGLVRCGMGNGIKLNER